MYSTEKRIDAGHALQAARERSRMLQSAAAEQFSPELIDAYLSALNAEESARAVYSAAIDAENIERAANAKWFALINR